jgi:hypothetical protein
VLRRKRHDLLAIDESKRIGPDKERIDPLARCTLLLSYGLQKFRDVWQRELRFSKCGAVIQT